MAKLLHLIVLAAAACVGYGSFTTERPTGISFTLDEASLSFVAPSAKAQFPDMHPAKAIGKYVHDAVVLEAARGILHLTGSPSSGGSLGGAFADMIASDERAAAAIEATFKAPASGWLDGAQQILKGSWQKSQLLRHAKAVEDFAAGRSTDAAAYEKGRSKIFQLLKRFRKSIGGSDPIPFELFPQWRADVLPGAPAVTVSGGKCYPSYTASASVSGQNSSHITVTLAAQGTPSSFLCSEQIVLIAGGTKFHFELYGAGTPSKSINIDVASVLSDSASNWFLQAHGIRAFIIATDGILSTVGSLIDTLTLLAGFASMSPPPAVLDANLFFINNYIQGGGKVPRMGPLSVPRPANNSVVAGFDPSNIQSGDLLMLLRRDGLDPMIGWGEGSLAGHSVVAIRTGPAASDLQICESTTQDAYWPTNGIQCHEWQTWVQLCINAGQNVVFVPLDEATRKTFNTSKALEFFNAHKGFDYGYSNFLFGWLDTATQNFPCTPSSNYTTCLVLEFAEQLAITLDSIFGSETINFFRQALAHRTGQWTASPADTPNVLQSIQFSESKMGKPFGELIQIVEQDSWQYQMHRDQTTAIHLGKSMVCCVFVCNMWKAGGVFDRLGANFTCGEQTLWDIFSMKIFDGQRMGDNRPDVCKKADPTNPLCQLMGDITMHLAPDVNTRELYPNMGERCAALAPEYIRPDNC